MRIADICTRIPVTIDAQQPLQQAAKLMRDHHVGLLVITGGHNSNHQVLGVLTDRDLVIHGMVEPTVSKPSTVGDLAHTDLAVVADDGTLDDALEAMAASSVRRLLVKNKQGQLAGVLSIDDLFEVYAEQLGRLVKVLRSGRMQEVLTEATRAAFGSVATFPVFGTADWSDRRAG